MSPPNVLDTLDPCTPVVVGAAVATQWLDEPGAGDEAVELMAQATRAAADDAGVPALLPAVQRIAVPGGSWQYPDPGRYVAERIGATAATTSLVQTGIPQQSLFNDTYAAILDGTVDVGVIVGGEAARRAALARRAGVELHDTDQGAITPDDLQTAPDVFLTPIELAGGVNTPMAPFAIMDSALRHAEGLTVDEHRDEIARLYAGFNAVAGTYPHAAFPKPLDAEFIRDPSPENRPFAFPYNKWHCAQMNVDQAAAILVCSAEAARRAGVDPERVVVPVVSVVSTFSLPISLRRDPHRWPAMEVMGAAAAAHLGHPLSDIELAELYSWFPAAIRVQQRALGLPSNGVPTITGGEPFAGGPWNNFVLQATAAMIERVRAEPGAPGLVTTLSGLLNKGGLAVYTTAPEQPLLLADLVDEVAAATPQVDAVADHRGPATVLGYTVQYDGMTPATTTAFARTADGATCVASSADADLAERVTHEELVGVQVSVDGTTFTA
jgi:acetyl-CoA C-acetyltransferase